MPGRALALLAVAIVMAGCASPPAEDPTLPFQGQGPEDDAAGNATEEPAANATAPAPAPANATSPPPANASAAPPAAPPREVHNASYAYVVSPPADDAFDVPGGFRFLNATFRLPVTSIPCTERVTLTGPSGAGVILGPAEPNSCSTAYREVVASAAGRWTVSFEGTSMHEVRLLVVAEP